jgi:hypothetical protein
MQLKVNPFDLRKTRYESIERVNPIDFRLHLFQITKTTLLTLNSPSSSPFFGGSLVLVRARSPILVLYFWPRPVNSGPVGAN